MGVDHDPGEADGEEHGRKARPLRLVLRKAQDGHEERHQDDAAADAEQARQGAPQGPDPQGVRLGRRPALPRGAARAREGRPGEVEEEEHEEGAQGPLREQARSLGPGPDAREEPQQQEGGEPQAYGVDAVVGEDSGQADGEEQHRQRHPLRLVLAHAEEERQHGDQDHASADAERAREQAGDEPDADAARGEVHLAMLRRQALRPKALSGTPPGGLVTGRQRQ